jgi:catalase
VPVIGRFALAGGNPAVADAPAVTRSLALRFMLPNGEEWRTGMNAIPVFPLSTPQAFYEQLIASTPDPATGKPNPAKLTAFLVRHPETLRALQLIARQPIASGFDNSTFNSLDAFRFVNAAGATTAVRWSMVPLEPFATDGTEPGERRPRDYLFERVIELIGRAPLQWHLVIILGKPTDQTRDPTLAWPEDREQVDVGTLTLDSAQSENAGACRDINFDPLILPSGIEPSDDPLLSARSATYAESFTRREGEAKTPSVIRTPAVHSEIGP